MSYRILEARIEFTEKQLTRVTVLVDINLDLSDVRAISANNKPSNGYTCIMPDEKISEELLQRVAGSGRQMEDREEIFPHSVEKYRRQAKLSKYGN